MAFFGQSNRTAGGERWKTHAPRTACPPATHPMAPTRGTALGWESRGAHSWRPGRRSECTGCKAHLGVAPWGRLNLAFCIYLGEEIHLCILGSLSESWHLRAATYVQGQKYPLVVIPFWGSLPSHPAYLISVKSSFSLWTECLVQRSQLTDKGFNPISMRERLNQGRFSPPTGSPSLRCHLLPISGHLRIGSKVIMSLRKTLSRKTGDSIDYIFALLQCSRI